MTTPLVSIITVTYNAEKYLEQTIKSVTTQSYKNIEYIIIDGQSTDGTAAIIQRYRKHIAYYLSEPDNGIYDAMNKGIRKAAGELIGIINASDFYQPDAVAHIVRAWIDHPQYGIFYGNTNFYFDNGCFLKEKKAAPNMDNLYKGIYFCHASVFVTKATYQKHGLFDLRYKLSGDFDFALRNYKAGTQFFYIDKVIANFRTGGISAQNNTNSTQECYQSLIANGYPEPVAQAIRRRWIRKAQYNTMKQQLYKWKVGRWIIVFLCGVKQIARNL
ncbi:MAG: glycosyltransferase [Prevotellaceae bacterium]|jgi:glycosyltransferase involved in cell wall biosynthesis|nr:glycosyltransferase [Prevotellaceae bacterium]